MYVVPIERDGMNKKWLRTVYVRLSDVYDVFACKSVAAFSVWICLSSDFLVITYVIYECVPVVICIVVNEPWTVITIPWWYS